MNHRESCLIPRNRFEHLFHAALSEFCIHSYDSASLNTIIRNAGMSKGSFYHWFGDKLTLYTWVVTCIAEVKNHGTKHIDIDVNLDFFEYMRVLIKQNLSFSQENHAYYTFWRKMLAEDPAFLELIKVPMLMSSKALLEQKILQEMKNGHIASNFNTGHVVSLITFVLLHIDELVRPDMDTDEISSLVDTAIGMLKHGFTR